MIMERELEDQRRDEREERFGNFEMWFGADVPLGTGVRSVLKGTC